MGVKHPTVKILSTRTSECGTAPVPAFVLSSGDVSLQMFSDIGNVTVLVGTVGALVPLVLSGKTTCTLM